MHAVARGFKEHADRVFNCFIGHNTTVTKNNFYDKHIIENSRDIHAHFD